MVNLVTSICNDFCTSEERKDCEENQTGQHCQHCRLFQVDLVIVLLETKFSLDRERMKRTKATSKNKTG